MTQNNKQDSTGFDREAFDSRPANAAKVMYELLVEEGYTHIDKDTFEQAAAYLEAKVPAPDDSKGGEE